MNDDIQDTGNLFFKKTKSSPSKIKSLEDLHHQYEILASGRELIQDTKFSKTRFPYEFLVSPDRGWWPCDITAVDKEKETVSILFYHPDAYGWIDTCSGGLFDDEVNVWRVRVRGE